VPVSVSIITPCYNGARYLRETVQSALAQSRPPFEIVVVDDGSTDESASIAEGFGEPVRVIRQANHGESHARNRGLDVARGSHVLFLDADDLLAPEALARLAGALDGRPGAVALMGCAWFSSSPDRPDRTAVFQHERFYPGIIESNFAPPLCWLAPRDLVLRAGGFSEGLHWFEDWDLWWRVGLEEPELVPVNYVGGQYRQHANSQLSTVSAANRARGHVAVMARVAEALVERPTMLQMHGNTLFWSVWSAIRHARSAGIAWRELQSISAVLNQLARRGPASVSSLGTARLFRLLGVRLGFTLQGARSS
jgi:glycosyltransferase involved in cell wall biosynthesis